MTKSTLKSVLNKASTIIKVTKETKDKIILQVSVDKRKVPMASTKEILLDFIKEQRTFNSEQVIFNNEQRTFNAEQKKFNVKIESKVDANTNMIKQAHPDLFNKS